MTGRTHQIRVHLEAIGHPVAGDPVYGTGTSRRGPGRPRPPVPPRLAARADLAIDGHLIRATAPLPPELESVLDGLREVDRGDGADRSDDRAGPLGRGRAVPARDGRRRRARMLVIISGPSRRRQGHRHRRAAGRAPDDPDYHYVVTCTTRAAAAGRGRRRRLPLPDAATRSPRSASAGEFLEANEVHGNWYGTPARPGPRGPRARPRRDPQDRRPGRRRSSSSRSRTRC